jgi:phage shock protein A
MDRSDELDRRAQSALEAVREDTARLLLTRRRAVVSQQRLVAGEMAAIDDEHDRLMLARDHLVSVLEQAPARQETAAARYSAAELHVGISQALAGVLNESPTPGDALAQTEEQALTMQARAAALDELIAAGALGVQRERTTDLGLAASPGTGAGENLGDLIDTDNRSDQAGVASPGSPKWRRGSANRSLVCRYTLLSRPALGG